MRLQRRERRDRLPGRARRIHPVDRAVQRRVVHLLGGRASEALCREPLGRHAAGIDARVVGRVGRHREDRAVARVERHDRAAVCLVLPVSVREPDSVADRVLGRALQLEVERQANRLARLLRPNEHEVAAGMPEGVDGELLEPGLAAKVAVVGRLEPTLADRVAGLVAVLAQALQLGGGDLRDVAEQLRREGAVGVAAQEGRDDPDARELLLVLVDVVDRRVALDRLAHGHRRDRVVPAGLDLHEHLPYRHLQHLRELPQLGEPGRPRLGQVGRRELHGRPADVGDQRVAVAVEDLAALGRDADRADLVVERRVQVLRPREHL